MYWQGLRQFQLSTCSGDPGTTLDQGRHTLTGSHSHLEVETSPLQSHGFTSVHLSHCCCLRPWSELWAGLCVGKHRRGTIRAAGAGPVTAWGPGLRSWGLPNMDLCFTLRLGLGQKLDIWCVNVRAHHHHHVGIHHTSLLGFVARQREWQRERRLLTTFRGRYFWLPWDQGSMNN